MNKKDYHKNPYDAKSIKVKSLTMVEAVRSRPAIYVNDIDKKGLYYLVDLLIDNSIDEVRAGYCDQINVTLHKGNYITVMDNGRGIPVKPVQDVPYKNKSALEVVMTTIVADDLDYDTGCLKIIQYYRNPPHPHERYMYIVNALSAKTSVEVSRDGNTYRQNYEYGHPTGDVQQVSRTKKTGTKICFKPDPAIFKKNTIFEYKIIHNRLREFTFLNRGVTIYLKDERSGIEDTFHYKNGIVSFVEHLNRKNTPIHFEPIFISGTKEMIQIEIAFQYANGCPGGQLSFANNKNTTKNSPHIAVFISTLTKCINDRVCDSVVTENTNIKLHPNDISKGLTLVMSIRDSHFWSYCREQDKWVMPILESICRKELSKYFALNPDAVKQILNNVQENNK